MKILNKKGLVALLLLVAAVIAGCSVLAAPVEGYEQVIIQDSAVDKPVQLQLASQNGLDTGDCGSWVSNRYHLPESGASGYCYVYPAGDTVVEVKGNVYENDSSSVSTPGSPVVTVNTPTPPPPTSEPTENPTQVVNAIHGNAYGNPNRPDGNPNDVNNQFNGIVNIHEEKPDKPVKPDKSDKPDKSEK